MKRVIPIFALSLFFVSIRTSAQSALSNEEINKRLPESGSWASEFGENMASLAALLPDRGELQSMMDQVPQINSSKVEDPYVRYVLYIRRFVKQGPALEAHLNRVRLRLDADRKKDADERDFTKSLIDSLEKLENSDNKSAAEKFSHSLDPTLSKLDSDASSVGQKLVYTEATSSAPSLSSALIERRSVVASTDPSRNFAALSFPNAPATFDSRSASAASRSMNAGGSAPAAPASAPLGNEASSGGTAKIWADSDRAEEKYLPEPKKEAASIAQADGASVGAGKKNDGILPADQVQNNISTAFGQFADARNQNRGSALALEKVNLAPRFNSSADAPSLPGTSSSGAAHSGSAAIDQPDSKGSSPASEKAVPVVAGHSSGKSSSEAPTKSAATETNASAPVSVAEKPAAPVAASNHAPEAPAEKKEFLGPYLPPGYKPSEAKPVENLGPVAAAPSNNIQNDPLLFPLGNLFYGEGEDPFASSADRATPPIPLRPDPSSECRVKFTKTLNDFFTEGAGAGVGKWFDSNIGAKHLPSGASRVSLESQAWALFSRKPSFHAICESGMNNPQAYFEIVDSYSAAVSQALQKKHNLQAHGGCVELKTASIEAQGAYRNLVSLHGRLLAAAAYRIEGENKKTPAAKDRSLPIVINAALLPRSLSAGAVAGDSFSQQMAACRSSGLAEQIWAHESSLRRRLTSAIYGETQTCAPTFEMRLIENPDLIESGMSEFTNLLEQNPKLYESDERARNMVAQFTTFPKKSNDALSGVERLLAGSSQNKYFTTYMPDQIKTTNDVEKCSDVDRIVRRQHQLLVHLAALPGSHLLAARQEGRSSEASAARKH